MLFPSERNCKFSGFAYDERIRIKLRIKEKTNIHEKRDKGKKDPWRVKNKN